MVDRIHRIVAGHENQDAYADAFLKHGVVATGWNVGDISKMNGDEIQKKAKAEGYGNPQEAKSVLLRFRDSIAVGDPVIAYKSPNTIVAVGRIVGDYYYDDKDNLGSSKGLHYPNKRKVEWMEKPRMFNRMYLPEDFRTAVSIPGAFKTLEYDFSVIEKELSKVPEEEEKEKTLEVESEEQMRVYFKNNIKELGPDLVSLDERDTSVGQADILAKDKDFWVVIEVKRNATDSAVGQLLGYINAIKEDKGSDKVRGIIIAENITDRVKKAVLGLNITMYTCKLRFVAKKVK